MKHVKRLLATMMVLTTVLPAPLAQAQGGLAFRPYWTFTTGAPVTHIEAGDIDGDGLAEVVAATADNWIYALENDGALAWRYETGFPAGDLALIDLEAEGGAEEIVVGNKEPLGDIIVLGGDGKPVCVQQFVKARGYAIGFVDLEGDGRLEIIHGADDGIHLIDSTHCSELGYNIGSLQPIVSIWTGDVDSDGQAEFVPSFFGGRAVYALEGQGILLRKLAESEMAPVQGGEANGGGNLEPESRGYAWHTPLDSEVALVQGGDVDGDGQPELVVLGTAWDLILLAGNGSQIWHQGPLPVGEAAGPRGPGN